MIVEQLPKIGFALGVALLIFAFTRGAADKVGLPQNQKLYRRNVLLTQAEQVLFHRLCLAFPDHLVFAQVALNQLVAVDREIKNKSIRTRAQFKINPKSVDFVLCRKDGHAVAAIELDDASHQRADRQRADKEKSRALDEAGIALHRFEARNMPNVTQIKQRLMVEENPTA